METVNCLCPADRPDRFKTIKWKPGVSTKLLIATHCCPVFFPNTNSLPCLYGAAIVLLGSKYIGLGPGCFSVHLVYICNNSLHASHSCKDTSVGDKKTMINTDYLGILAFLGLTNSPTTLSSNIVF